MKTLEQVREEMRMLSDVYDEFTIIVGNNRKCDIVVCDDYMSEDGCYYLVYGPLPWLGGKFDRVCNDLANIETLIKENKSEEEECMEYYNKYHGTDRFDASWFSDWYKDIFGYRPRFI